MKYNTKQKQLIIETLKKYDNQYVCAKELEEILLLSVSKATLYRYLDDLSKENIINKHYNEQNNCYEYQYIDDDDCLNHLHLKCNVCGKIIHLHEFNINTNNSFVLDYAHTLLYGTCNNCLKRKS